MIFMENGSDKLEVTSFGNYSYEITAHILNCFILKWITYKIWMTHESKRFQRDASLCLLWYQCLLQYIILKHHIIWEAKTMFLKKH